MPSQSPSCHLCHLHNHGAEPLLRTVPLRSSRNKTRHSRSHHHSSIADDRDHSRITHAQSSSSLARLIEQQQSLPDSRNNSFNRYHNDISVLPHADYSRQARPNNSTQSLEINPHVHTSYRSRSSSLPRRLLDHSHQDIRQEHDILTRPYPLLTRADNYRRPATKPPGLGFDTTQDYYFHIQRRPKAKLAGRRCKLKTVLLIGCYSLLVLASVLVGVIICYQNGWLGLGTYKERLSNDVTDITPKLSEISYGPKISNIQPRGDILTKISSTSGNEFTRQGKQGRSQPVDVAGLFPLRNVPSSGSPIDLLANQTNQNPMDDDWIENPQITYVNNNPNSGQRINVDNSFDEGNFLNKLTDDDAFIPDNDIIISEPNFENEAIKNSNHFIQDGNIIRNQHAGRNLSVQGSDTINHHRDNFNSQAGVINTPNFGSNSFSGGLAADRNPSISAINSFHQVRSNIRNPTNIEVGGHNQHNNDINTLTSGFGQLNQKNSMLQPQGSNINKQLVIKDPLNFGSNVVTQQRVNNQQSTIPINRGGNIIQQQLNNIHTQTDVTNTANEERRNFHHVNNLKTEPAVSNILAINIPENVKNNIDIHYHPRNFHQNNGNHHGHITSRVRTIGNVGEGIGRNRQVTDIGEASRSLLKPMRQDVVVTPSPFQYRLKNKLPTLRLILRSSNLATVIHPTAVRNIQITELGPRFQPFHLDKTFSDVTVLSDLVNDRNKLQISSGLKISEITNPSGSFKSLDSAVLSEHSNEKNLAGLLRTSSEKSNDFGNQMIAKTHVIDNKGTNKRVTGPVEIPKQIINPAPSPSHVADLNIFSDREMNEEEVIKLTDMLREKAIEQLTSNAGPSDDKTGDFSSIDNISTSELIDLLAVRRMRDLLNSDGGVQTLFSFLRNSRGNNGKTTDNTNKNAIAPPFPPTIMRESLRKIIREENNQQISSTAVMALTDKINGSKASKNGVPSEPNVDINELNNINRLELERLIRLHLSRIISENPSVMPISEKKRDMNTSGFSSQVQTKLGTREKVQTTNNSNKHTINSSTFGMIPLQVKHIASQDAPAPHPKIKEQQIIMMNNKKSAFSESQNRLNGNNKLVPASKVLPTSSSNQSNFFVRDIQKPSQNRKRVVNSFNPDIPRFRVRLADNPKRRLKVVLDRSVLAPSPLSPRIQPKLSELPLIHNQSNLRRNLQTVNNRFTSTQLSRIRSVIEEIQRRNAAKISNQNAPLESDRLRDSTSGRFHSVSGSQVVTSNVNSNHGHGDNSHIPHQFIHLIGPMTEGKKDNIPATSAVRHSDIPVFPSNNQNSNPILPILSHRTGSLNTWPQFHDSTNPKLSVLIQTEENEAKVAQHIPFSRAQITHGRSDPFTELVDPQSMKKTGANPGIIRTWTTRDNDGIISRGQVRGDGSFTFTNCSPARAC